MRILIAAAAVAALSFTAVEARTIIVSGDSNIGNAVDGSNGAMVNPGNATFFGNVLGAGATVKMAIGGGADTGINASAASINTFYNSLGGVSSTLDGPGTLIDAAFLAGADLFIGILPDDPYSGSEIMAISDFLDGGGSAFFMGEWDNFQTGENAAINAALAALGSTMSIVDGFFDGGFTVTGDIGANPLTAGVTSFTVGAGSQIIGGDALVRFTSGEVAIAVESAVVPLPAPVFLMIAALGGIALVGRKRA